MGSTMPSRQKLDEIQDIAEGWGKLLAKQAFPDGPGLDVALHDMEGILALATRALVNGAVKSLTQQQAQAFGSHAPCPGCQKPCKLQLRKRPMKVRGGQAELYEAVGRCWKCRRLFFSTTSASEGG